MDAPHSRAAAGTAANAAASGGNAPAADAPVRRAHEEPPPALRPCARKQRKPAPAPPPPARSGRLLARLAPEHTALFRFFLEAYENLAYFTVLETKTALLKIIYAPQRERAVRRALAEMAQSLPFAVEEWPATPSAVRESHRRTPPAAGAGAGAGDYVEDCAADCAAKTL